mmetsp:Transcript_28619/g.64536  ORF Transcript_28619/g.64536 Transcript_28619/m.64536 type:complete len:615 (+) Transcript_28619:53-1897(+)
MKAFCEARRLEQEAGAAEDEEVVLLAEGRQTDAARWSARVLPCFLIAAVVLALGVAGRSVFRGDEQADAVTRLAEFQKETPPKFWLMCPDDDCVWHAKPYSDWIFKTYPQNSWSVSGAVDDTVSHLDGVPQDMWNTIRQRWMASPPMFKGQPVSIQDLANFMRQTLQRDPFWVGGQRVPWINLREGGAGGPVHSKKKAIAINQRQLAYVIINSLMGNKLQGVETGLDAAIQRCTDGEAPGGRSEDIIHSLLAYLAVLSKELGPNEDGAYLVGTTPGPMTNAWLNEMQFHTMTKPTLCNHEKLEAGTCGLPDFMAAGQPHQALTDIAGMDVGGGAQLCHVANSQDESLVIFYPEALAFAFFVGDGHMLPVPFTLLGARRYLNSIFGETGVGAPFNNLCGTVDENNLLNSGIMQDVVPTHVSLSPVQIKSAAFVAVASYCSDCHRGECSEPEMFNNQCDSQRRHLDQDISMWLQAYDSANYHAAVADTFSSVITRIGTGPWGGGLWQGDCQQYFLAVWLATSMLPNVQLDYYIYDHFCENAGHQCFVLPQELCKTCIEMSGMTAVIDASHCGQTGAEDMVKKIAGRQVEDIFYLVRDVGPPPQQVFDLLNEMVRRI